MSRSIRIQYSGASYHIMSRGNDGNTIFQNTKDYNIFLETFADVLQDYNWVCYAYCLMPNHYHLLVKTPDPNLSMGITKDIYDKKHQDYQDQIQRLEIEMSEHQKADYDYKTTVATVFSVARRAKTIFENSSEVAGKRAFLNYILQNPIVTGKTLTFELRKPFNLVLNLANAQQKTTAISSSRPFWLRILNEIRTFFKENPEQE